MRFYRLGRWFSEESASRLFKILPSRLIPSAWDQLSRGISIGRSSGRKGYRISVGRTEGREEEGGRRRLAAIKLQSKPAVNLTTGWNRAAVYRS